jgi:multiple sugar transport system ATP-binding protein
MGQLSLRGVRKRFGDVEVIKGVDLEIRDGEFMVFVGPSGCGKSTTLRLIAGLEDISDGELFIDGRRANDLHPADRGAAMVFQSYALYPQMTVAENMAFALRMAKVPKADREARVRRAADTLRITHLLDRHPKDLSGGQRQRVAIGRAIVRSPAVFLFDEPLSNLDASLRVDMRIELARLRDALGTTMVYVTHDQVEAMTLGDRIAVFNDGRIEQLGAPMQVYRAPDTAFVASFLGTPRINFIEAPPSSGGCAEHAALWRAATAGLDRPPHRAGLRPEHLALADDGVPATVALAERLGDCVVVHVRVHGVEPLLTLKVNEGEAGLDAGQAVRLRVQPGATLAFGPDGRRLH